MAVILIPKFTKADITKMLADRKERIYQATLNALQKIGEEFVVEARDTDTYNDVTGNLRSSIGYVILFNGKQLFDNFKTVTRKRYGGLTETRGKKNQDAKGTEGMNKAKEVIAELKLKRQSGLCLIVTAGADYAAAVEARGYDVLTNSSITATTNLRTSLERLSKKIDRLGRA